MSWTGDTYKSFLYPFWKGRSGGRDLRRLLRRVGRLRRPPVRKHGRGCCCCPLVLLLGLAGLGSIAGFFFLGLRFLGWA